MQPSPLTGDMTESVMLLACSTLHSALGLGIAHCSPSQIVEPLDCSAIPHTPWAPRGSRPGTWDWFFHFTQPYHVTAKSLGTAYLLHSQQDHPAWGSHVQAPRTRTESGSSLQEVSNRVSYCLGSFVFLLACTLGSAPPFLDLRSVRVILGNSSPIMFFLKVSNTLRSKGEYV